MREQMPRAISVLFLLLQYSQALAKSPKSKYGMKSDSDSYSGLNSSFYLSSDSYSVCIRYNLEHEDVFHIDLYRLLQYRRTFPVEPLVSLTIQVV